jgi:hypothetical protein
MPLTDLKIRSSKPRHKAYKLFDSGGLYLEVTAAGAKVLALEVSLRRKGKAARLWSLSRCDAENGAREA